MSVTVNLDGTEYAIPTTGNTGWGQVVTTFLQALAELSNTHGEDIETLEAAIAAIDADELGVDFGTNGQYPSGVRIWGVDQQIGLGTDLTCYGMTQPGTVGVAVDVTEDTTGRTWLGLQTSVDDVDALAGRAHGADQVMWNQAPRLQTLIRTASVAENGVANQRIWIALTDTALGTVDEEDTAKYIGLRYTAGVPFWVICSSDGTTASEEVTNIAVAAATQYFVDIRVSAGTALYSVNGSDPIVKSTNIPSISGAPGTDTARVYIVLGITTDDGNVKMFRYHHCALQRG